VGLHEREELSISEISVTAFRLFVHCKDVHGLKVTNYNLSTQ